MATMTPSQYADKYKALRVFMTADNAAPSGQTSMYLPGPKMPATPGKPMEPGRWERFQIDRYRLNGSGYAGYLTQALKNEVRIGIKVMCIDGSVQTHALPPADIRYAVVAPFYGKGYPEECQVVLQLWKRYGVKAPDINTLITKAGIGLDCSAFVGGYIERRGAPGAWMRKKETMTGYYIKDLMGPATGYIGSWDELKPPGNECLLLAHCDGNGVLKDHDPNDPLASGHIVITEPGTLTKSGAKGPVIVDAVESTGPVGDVGLQRTPYKILSMKQDGAKKGIFYVQRGSKAGQAEEFLFFRIRPLR